MALPYLGAILAFIQNHTSLLHITDGETEAQKKLIPAGPGRRAGLVFTRRAHCRGESA